MYGKTENFHVNFDFKFHYDTEKVVDTIDTVDNPSRVDLGQAEEKHVNLANLNDSTATIDQNEIDQNTVNQLTSTFIRQTF